MFLYVMQSGDRVKVGISKNPYRRASSLTTSNPNGVRLFGFAEIVSGAPAREVEKKAHALLAKFTVSGEWFHLDPWYALTVIEHVAEGRHSPDLVAAILDRAGMERPSRDDEDAWRQHRQAWRAATDAIENSDWPYKKHVLLRL